MTQINFAQSMGKKAQGGEVNPSTLISNSSVVDGADSLAFDIALLVVMQPQSVISTALPTLTHQINTDDVSNTPLQHDTEVDAEKETKTEAEMSNESNQQLLDVLLQGGAPYTVTAAPIIPMTRTVPFSDAKQINSTMINEMVTPSPLSVLETAKSVNLTLPVERVTSDLMLNSSAINRVPPPDMPTVTLSAGLNNSPAANAEQSLKTADMQLTLQGNREQWSQHLRTALGDRIQLQIDNRVQQATIRLDPPDMGKIDITVNFDAGKLQIHINANQGDIYRALQLSSNELRQNLLGLNTTQVDVQVSSNSQQHQRKDQATTSEPEVMAAQIMDTDEELGADDGTLLITV